MNKKHGPWKIMSRNTRYKNEFGLSVYEDKVLRPDGKEGIFGWIKLGDGISVLPVDKDLNVYLGKEFQYGLGEECLEPSSGGIEKKENAQEAAKRELREELGIKAKQWIDLGYTNPISGRVNTKQYMFIAYDLEFEKQDLENGEIIKKIKIPLEDAVKLVMNNEIKDTQSSLLILLAHNYIKQLTHNKL